jgi:hypothetical protein
MVTRAAVEIRSPREAVLRQGGKQLVMRVVEPVGARLQLFDIEHPPAEHDSPNPGTRMIGFQLEPAGGASDLVIRFTPGSFADSTPQALRVRPLTSW